jgi:transposase
MELHHQTTVTNLTRLFLRVSLVSEGGHPPRQVAADLGIGEGLLRRWRRDHEQEVSVARTGTTAATDKLSLEEEVRRLRRENERLRQERDILKKAVAIFSEGPK